MSDFPVTYVIPNASCTSTSDLCSLMGHLMLNTSIGESSQAISVANQANYIPIQIEIPVFAFTIATRVNTQAGNVDVGVYDEKGNAIVTKGSTAVAVAGLQTFDLTASISLGSAKPLLKPGTYFLASSYSSTSAAIFGISLTVPNAQISGVQQQATALPLPSTATFATPSGTIHIPALSLITVATA